MLQDSEDKIVNAPAKFKSPVWQYFGFPRVKEGDKYVTKQNQIICKLCSHEIRYTCKNTSNMAIHLRRKHGIETSAQTVTASKDSQPSISTSSQSAASSSSTQQQQQTSGVTLKAPSQPTIAESLRPKLSANSVRAREMTRLITILLATDLRPFTLVENKAFRNLMSYAEPRYTVPSRATFSQKEIPALYKDICHQIKNKIQDAHTVAITTDGWTSRVTQSYITITSHFIDCEWALNSYVLQTRPIFESHTGSNIAEVLQEAVVEWNLERGHGVQPITTDSAANMGVAAQEAGMNPHFRCFAHIINLAAQQALKINDLQLLLGRIKRIVNFFHRSSTAAHQLKLKQELLQIPSHKLLNEVKTRWNSAYDMIERCLEQQPAVMAVLMSQEVKKDQDLDTLTTSDVTAAEQLVSLLKPLKTITTILCEDKEPTLSMVMPLMNNLTTSLAPKQDNSRICKQVKDAVLQDLKKRYQDQKIREVMIQAKAVDPRFKSLPFLGPEERIHTFTSLISLADSIYTSFKTQVRVKQEPEDVVSIAQPPLPQLDTADEVVTVCTSAEPSAKKQKPHQSALDSLFGDVFVVKEEAGVKNQVELIEEELQTYKQQDTIGLNQSPLEWWKEHQYQFPHLCHTARHLLCIPATSVASERVFSTAGDVVTAQRAALSPENVDMLVFLKKNVTLK